jgi:hypothetical protein
VREDRETFLYYSIAGSYGAVDPQAGFYPEYGKEFSLHYRTTKLTCTLSSR